MYNEVVNELTKMSKLNSVNGICAKCILDNIKVIANYNGREIANLANVSPSVPTKIAQELKLEGFKELKKILIEERSYDTNHKQYYESLQKSLQNTFESVDEDTVMELISYIVRAERVNIFAVGGTNLIATDFALKLERLNKWVTCHSDNHLQLVNARLSSSNSLAIGVSYSGKTKDVMEHLQIAKKKGAKTALITNSDKTFDFVDVHISSCCNENNFRMYSTTSRIALLSICDYVYLRYLSLNEELNHELLLKTQIIK